MWGQTVPCRLTDFKAVHSCYVPLSFILGAAGGLFFSGAQSLPLVPLSKELTGLLHERKKGGGGSKNHRTVFKTFFLFQIHWSRSLCAVTTVCHLLDIKHFSVVHNNTRISKCQQAINNVEFKVKNIYWPMFFILSYILIRYKVLIYAYTKPKLFKMFLKSQIIYSNCVFDEFVFPH